MEYFLAIDIGASNGRHMVGWTEDGKLYQKEIHRFPNAMEKRNGSLCWNVEQLFQEILNGMKKCSEMGIKPKSMAIDTWAVDFVLLDADGKLIGEPVAYRDVRTKGMDEKVYQKIPEKELYARTGIQKQVFNTIYQLMAVKENSPEQLLKAHTFLMLPDYFHYLLTGQKAVEYTNATTTQLVNAKTRDWDDEMIHRLGYPREIFPTILQAGTELGSLTEEIQLKVGFSCKVVLPATHDTGSAVLAMPCLEEHGLYISSGTWSLIGTENEEPVCNDDSRLHNLTNEGGYEYRYRYLKNIMGLWMIQSIRHETNDAYSFAELCALAEDAADFPSRVDVNDACFLAPENMTEEVKRYCADTNQPVPKKIGEIATVIYQSLAQCYGRVLTEIEELTGKQFDTIYIIGGGSNADYLNQLTAKVTNRTVYAGPTEATALGNLMVQMITDGAFTDLKEARTCILRSCSIRRFEP
ncbi:MAG: rhamnulokinase [Lachnospiraceae bacterium]